MGEIECVNKCGNLTDSPDSDQCETCRDMGTVTGAQVKMQFIPFGRWYKFLMWLFPRQYNIFMDCEVKFVQEELTLE